MALDPSKFETLTPSQFITFTIPNPIRNGRWLVTTLLRVAVLDSPQATFSKDDVPFIAAMVVPVDQETDWKFCTEAGHLQLLFNFPNISRLILFGNNIPPTSIGPVVYVRPPVMSSVDKEAIEDQLKPLVMALHPKSCFREGVVEAIFVRYEEDVLYSVVKHRGVSPFVGEFLIEDFAVVSKSSFNKEFRRKLRFKRTPNLIQTQVPLIPIIDADDEGNVSSDTQMLMKLQKGKFMVNTGVLVHPYLTPMVTGIFLIAYHLNEKIQQGFTPRALCLGVGGGALLSFLNTQLGFEVVGIEDDEVVLRVAKQFFGLNDEESIRLIVGDAIEWIEKHAATKGDADDRRNDGVDAKFDVVMADLDCSEPRTGISAPPPEFVRKPVFEAVRFLLSDHGVFIMNTIPPNEAYYTSMVQELQEVFHKVYQIEIGSEGNFVVMAILSPFESTDHDQDFVKKLKSVIPGDYFDTIVEFGTRL